MKRSILTACVAGLALALLAGCSTKRCKVEKRVVAPKPAGTCNAPVQEKVAYKKVKCEECTFLKKSDPACLDCPKPEKPAKPVCDGKTLAPGCVVRFTVVGQGVAPTNTISPAQAIALAKRAAVVDAYRQLAEKIYGVHVAGRDLIKNMVVKYSIVRADVDAIIRNAQIIDRDFKDGLYQVEMEVTLNGDKWYRRFASAR